MTIYTTSQYTFGMKRHLLQTEDFEKAVKGFIAKRKLKREDFDDFKRKLAENPEQGDVISGTGGIRKTRLKSAAKGKSGGFRVCYLDIEDKLIPIYAVYLCEK